MKIAVQWGDANEEYIKLTFNEGWTWKDFYDICAESTKMMHSVDHTVHVVADFRSSRVLPPGAAFTHLRNILTAYPDNWGIFIVVTESLFIQTLLDAFRNLFASSLRDKTFNAPTWQDALNLIESLQVRN